MNTPTPTGAIVWMYANFNGTAAARSTGDNLSTLELVRPSRQNREIYIGRSVEKPLVHKDHRQDLAAINTEDKRASILHNNCYGKGLYMSDIGYIDAFCDLDTHSKVRRKGPHPATPGGLTLSQDQALNVPGTAVEILPGLKSANPAPQSQVTSPVAPQSDREGRNAWKEETMLVVVPRKDPAEDIYSPLAARARERKTVLGDHHQSWIPSRIPDGTSFLLKLPGELITEIFKLCHISDHFNPALTHRRLAKGRESTLARHMAAYRDYGVVMDWHHLTI
ncbi:hypothetical protein FIE12Z_12905, partial [Fusarium flagelliforme]